MWVKFRASDAEKAVLRRNADVVGLTVSAYLRQAAFNTRLGLLTTDEFEVLIDLNSQLRGVATNVNQLAHSVNRRSSSLPNTDTLEQIAALLAELKPLIDDIRTLVHP